MSKKMKGFTLFEMMIVIAIIGVLAAFAIPSYQKYVLRTNRAAAAATMMDIAGLLENHHLQNGSYSASYIASINADSNYNAAPGSNNKLYSIQIVTDSTGSNANSQTYVITATPVDGSEQAKDECGQLILNSFGAKSSTAGSGCW